MGCERKEVRAPLEATVSFWALNIPATCSQGAHPRPRPPHLSPRAAQAPGAGGNTPHVALTPALPACSPWGIFRLKDAPAAFQKPLRGSGGRDCAAGGRAPPLAQGLNPVRAGRACGGHEGAPATACARPPRPASWRRRAGARERGSARRAGAGCPQNEGPGALGGEGRGGGRKPVTGKTRGGARRAAGPAPRPLFPLPHGPQRPGAGSEPAAGVRSATGTRGISAPRLQATEDAGARQPSAEVRAICPPPPAARRPAP